jgi:hypothetical protein
MSDSLNRESEKPERASHRRFYETNPPWKLERGATDENRDEKITKRTHRTEGGQKATASLAERP